MVINICMDYQDLLAQNGGVWGKNKERGGAMLTPNELVFTFRVFTSMPILVKIDQEM